MQLTSPAFLMIFLPFSLLLLLPFRGQKRLTVLMLLSILWLVLCNRNHLPGLLLLLSVPLFTYAILLPPLHHLPRVRLFFGTILPLFLLLTVRLLAEYGSADLPYPYGLTYLCLGAISLVIYRLRRQLPTPKTPTEFTLFLLFFPTLVAGPMLSPKDFLDRLEDVRPTTNRFTRGILLYMSGTIKCMGIAAVLLRYLTQILAFAGEQIYYITALLLPPVALLCLYFFETGTIDLARGVASMVGFPLPRGYSFSGVWQDPLQLFFVSARRLYHRLLCDIVTPITHRFPGSGGRVLSLALLLAVSVLFFRTRPEMLLFALSAFLLFFIPVFRGSQKRLPPVAKIFLLVLCLLLCAFTSLAILSPDPTILFTTKITASPDAAYDFYYMTGSLTDSGYLAIIVLLIIFSLLFSFLRPRLRRHIPPVVTGYFNVLETALLFFAFLLVWIYIIPQFPGYADLPHPIFYR